MAVERPQSEDPFASPPKDAADHEEANWGEDWESAFQAEDDVFFAEGGEEEEGFFQDDKAQTSGTRKPQTDLAASLAESLAGIPDQQRPARDAAAPPSALKASASSLFAGLAALISSQWQRLQALPLPLRIPAYLLPAVLLGVLLFMSSGGPDLATAPQPADSQPQSGAGALTQPDGAPGSAGDAPHQPALAEKVRKKWPFPSFLISVPPQDGEQPTTFVMVDITLVAALDAQEEPPADKKTFVRDIIYQFYLNHPVEDLRRFSLARGEMNRKLRAWLEKQWPGAPIESIIFDRYVVS
ncbi:flagellar basal body-associated FliL family protein [Thiovibrio sp. JS02]